MAISHGGGSGTRHAHRDTWWRPRLVNDIRSLSDFKRNTVDLLDRIRKTGNPMVLTINGKAELVVQDAEAYQALLDRVETLEGIQRGIADVKVGRTRPAQQVFDKLRRKHGIPR